MRPLPASVPEDAAATPSVRRQLAEGFAYLFRTGWLFATLAFAILYVLVVIGPIEVLLPFAVRDRVGAGPAGLSLVLAAYGVGSAVGALLVSSLRLPRRYLTVMLLCWGLGALPLAAFGLATVLWLMVVASFAVGFTDAVAVVIWGTLLQRRVPPHLLGRVSSLDFFVSLALMPVSMALAGPVGERVGIPVAFVVAAVVPPVLAVIALGAWRLPRDEVAHPLNR
jgi:MFS family permease